MVRQRRARGRLAAFARWSVRRRAAVLEGTIVLALVLAIGSLGLEDHLSSSAFTASGTESARADELLARRFKAAAPDLVLLAADDEQVTSGKAAAAGAELTRRVTRHPGVARVDSYWAGHSAQLLATDRRSALLAVDLAGDDAEAARTAQRLVPALARAFPPLRVTATGPTWANVEFIRQGKDDQRRAELVIAPLAVL
ncbi:MAG: MMPL family transporter, partial [Nonomuraea sp.]|nr:MMPL family transporter [Nonomuraea sp.]